MEKENIEVFEEAGPRTKRPRLSLSLKKCFEAVREEDMENICRGYVPPNTEKNTKWAVKCFNEWISFRNQAEGEKCPEDILLAQDAEALNKWIPRFIAEVRKADGSKYPPKSIHQLLSGILRYMRSVGNDTPNILDRRDTRFKSIQGACAVIFRELHRDRIGTSVCHTPVNSIDEEARLWDSGIIGVDTPKTLQRAVFFYVGKVICLRGGEEHRMHTQEKPVYTFQ